MTKRNSIGALAIALVALSPLTAVADIEIGQLTCRQTDRTNLIIFSEANFSCVFDPVNGSNERYIGAVSKVGVDLVANKVETLVWFVLAPTDTIATGSLSGEYYGASGDASVGAGVGARALVGGFERSFSLQPAAVSGQEGIGVAAGIERFTLKQ